MMINFFLCKYVPSSPTLNLIHDQGCSIECLLFACTHFAICKHLRQTSNQQCIANRTFLSAAFIGGGMQSNLSRTLALHLLDAVNLERLPS